MLLFNRQKSLLIIELPALAYMGANGFYTTKWMSWNSVFYKSDLLFANLLNKL
jgi:hypothetical protein